MPCFAPARTGAAAAATGSFKPAGSCAGATAVTGSASAVGGGAAAAVAVDAAVTDGAAGAPPPRVAAEAAPPIMPHYVVQCVCEYVALFLLPHAQTLLCVCGGPRMAQVTRDAGDGVNGVRQVYR